MFAAALRLSPVVARGGSSLVAVRGLRSVMASLVVSRGSRACELQWLWLVGLVALGRTRSLPGPGMEPVTPALAGGLLTTGPPGSPPESFIVIEVESKWAFPTDGVISPPDSGKVHVSLLL